MEEWKEYKLGDVCEVINGRAYKQHELLNKGKYPVLRVGNIFQGNNWYYSDLELSQDKYCDKGDLLYAWSCGFAPYIWDGGKTIYHYHIWKLVEDEKIINRKFLYYYLIINTKRFLGGTHGSVMLHLTKRDMENQVLTIPSIPTQQRIANILSSIDDKIEVNRRINEQLEELAQALFKSWFVDFEPFKDGNFVESELGMIPEGWKVGTFSEIVDSTLGGDWGKENLQGNYTKEVFCIRGADIPEIKNGNRGKMPIRYILEKNYLKKALTENDLVIEISGGSPTQSTGRVCRITSELLSKYNNALICTNFCRAIKPCDSYSSFIYYYWQYLYDQGRMFNYENGTTGIKNLMINDILEKEQVVIPKINVVKQYNDVIQTIATKIQKNGEEIETLSNLRDALLPKLMSGEIDVNEVKI